MRMLPMLLWVCSALATALPVQGYWKLLCAASEPEVSGPWQGSAMGMLRLERKLSLAWAELDLAWELSPEFGGREPGVLFGAGLPSPYRIRRAGGRIYPQQGDSAGSFRLRHEMDRASLTMAIGSLDLTAGRQAIFWGSGRLLRPTDFPAPVGAAELDSEERAGVDALRARWALGLMSELDGGILLGPEANPDSSAAWLRCRTYLWRADAAVLAAAYRGNVMLGLDLTRPAGGAGTWLEASLARLRAESGSGSRALLRLTGGADYSPRDNLYCALEYGYSSHGLGDEPATPLLESGVYLPGSHYAAVELRWQASPLLSSRVTGMVRLDRAGAWLGPRLEYSVAQNAYLQAGWQTGFGEDQAGFGSWPDLVWTSWAAYF